jgi:hypothetical protein
MSKNELIKDTEHWHGKNPPYSPNEEEIKIYKNLIKDHPVCLLGMTKELLPFCDLAVDLNPISIDKPTLKEDWNNLTGDFGTIIGDGVINLEGFQLVDKMSLICKRLVCRIFMEKLPNMKYAAFFPKEFPKANVIMETQQNIVIVVWEF